MQDFILGAVHWMSGSLLNRLSFEVDAREILKNYKGELKIINVYGDHYNGLVFLKSEAHPKIAQVYFDAYLEEKNLHN